MTLGITNKSDKEAQFTSLTFKDNPHFRLEGSPDFHLVVAAKSKATHAFSLAARPATAPQRLAGALKYSLGGVDTHKDFQLLINCSAVVYPLPLSPEKFAQVISENPAFVHEHINLVIPNSSLETVVRTVADALHLTLVNVKPPAASLYGRLTSGDHLAVLVKDNSESSFTVNLKTKETGFAQSLLMEVQALFK